MTTQELWDELDERLQKRWAGNTDPWAGPVDPRAHRRAVEQSRRDSCRERQEVCGCGMGDCGECGPRRADGWRPAKGSVRARALHADALLERAKVNGWVGSRA